MPIWKAAMWDVISSVLLRLTEHSRTCTTRHLCYHRDCVAGYCSPGVTLRTTEYSSLGKNVSRRLCGGSTVFLEVKALLKFCICIARFRFRCFWKLAKFRKVLKNFDSHIVSNPLGVAWKSWELLVQLARSIFHCERDIIFIVKKLIKIFKQKRHQNAVIENFASPKYLELGINNVILNFSIRVAAVSKSDITKATGECQWYWGGGFGFCK